MRVPAKRHGKILCNAEKARTEAWNTHGETKVGRIALEKKNGSNSVYSEREGMVSERKKNGSAGETQKRWSKVEGPY